MTARLYIHGPIPHPSDWIISQDPTPPAGHLKLAGCSITPRKAQSDATIVPSDAGEAPGTNLVLAQDAQLERLLRAFQRLNDAHREEIIKHAETIGGST